MAKKITKSKTKSKKKEIIKKKKTKRSSLIKGVSSRLPARILDNPSFEIGLKDIMKNYSGIYVLYRDDKLYYIGLTTNLHGRLKTHLKDRLTSKWNKFAIFRIRRVDYLKDIETLLIRVAEPPGNIKKGKFKSNPATDLNKKLRNILDGIKKEAEEVENALNNK
jgi:hypothetical protein